jgi:glutaredoxin 3
MPQTTSLDTASSDRVICPSLVSGTGARFAPGAGRYGTGVELYQAEWCPHSHKVRQRLTELGLDFTTRQVPADPEERTDLTEVAGTNAIPVLMRDGARPICGEDDILGFLSRFDERPDADAHREKSREEVPAFAV